MPKKSRARPSVISTKHALTPMERDFCKIYAAFGNTNHTEAYRRSFFADPKLAEKMPPPKKLSSIAGQLLRQPYIAAYIAEISKPASTNARTVLTDQVLFGDEAIAGKAAIKIFDQEDKLKFRDAVEQWCEHMVEIGTEVVVPLPGGEEVAFPLRAMFPQFADALPSVEVLDKTIAALSDYKAEVERREADPVVDEIMAE